MLLQRKGFFEGKTLIVAQEFLSVHVGFKATGRSKPLF
jgi:hypothetical protein